MVRPYNEREKHMRQINLKVKSSKQFRKVANFIISISNVYTGEITDESYYHLCVDPWTGEKLANTVANLSTTHFIALFPDMKSTSCERHLRTYKSLSSGM